MSLFDLGFIAVKAGVFGPDSPAGIGELFTLGECLVRGLAGIGGTQRANPLRLRVDNHHILVTGGFLLAAVVQGLFVRLLGPLPAPVGAINAVLPRFLLTPLGLSKLAAFAFRPDS